MPNSVDLSNYLWPDVAQGRQSPQDCRLATDNSLSNGLLNAYIFNNGGVIDGIRGTRYTGNTGSKVSPDGIRGTFNGSSIYVATAPIRVDSISITTRVRASNVKYIVAQNFNNNTVPIAMCTGVVAAGVGGIGAYAPGWRWSGVGGTNISGDGALHIITGTYDGSRLRYYIDGQLKSESVFAYVALDKTNNTPLDIGRYGNDNSYFSGDIEFVYIHNRVLLAHEVQALNDDHWQIFTPQQLGSLSVLSAGTSYALPIGSLGVISTITNASITAARVAQIGVSSLISDTSNLNLLFNRAISVEVNASVSSVTSAGLLFNRALQLATLDSTSTLTDVGLILSRNLTIDSLALTTTISPVALVYTPVGGYTLQIDSLAIACTSNSVGLLYNRILSVSAANFTVTGLDVNVLRGYNLSTSVLALLSTASDVVFTYSPVTGYTLVCDTLAVSMSLADAALLRTYVLSLESLGYTITCNAVGLTYGIPSAEVLQAEQQWQICIHKASNQTLIQ